MFSTRIAHCGNGNGYSRNLQLHQPDVPVLATVRGFKAANARWPHSPPQGASARFHWTNRYPRSCCGILCRLPMNSSCWRIPTLPLSEAADTLWRPHNVNQANIQRLYFEHAPLSSIMGLCSNLILQFYSRSYLQEDFARCNVLTARCGCRVSTQIPNLRCWQLSARE